MNKVIFLLSALIIISGCANQSPHQDNPVTVSTPLQRVQQQLVMPPLLPKHQQVALGTTKIVEVRLTVEEKQINIGNGAKIQAATLTVPSLGLPSSCTRMIMWS